jgi:hypothetical protein
MYLDSLQCSLLPFDSPIHTYIDTYIYIHRLHRYILYISAYYLDILFIYVSIYVYLCTYIYYLCTCLYYIYIGFLRCSSAAVDSSEMLTNEAYSVEYLQGTPLSQR